MSLQNQTYMNIKNKTLLVQKKIILPVSTQDRLAIVKG